MNILVEGQNVMYVSSNALSHQLITNEQIFLLNLLWRWGGGGSVLIIVDE
jgi:hypothetical protein